MQLEDESELQGMDVIELQGMKFLGTHGCLEREQTNPQPFSVDLCLYLPTKEAGQADDLRLTVNYAQAYEIVRRHIEGTSKKLIEALAEAIAQDLLQSFSLLHGVEVTVHKPQAPIAGLFDDVRVRIYRRQKA